MCLILCTHVDSSEKQNIALSKLKRRSPSESNAGGGNKSKRTQEIEWSGRRAVVAVKTANFKSRKTITSSPIFLPNSRLYSTARPPSSKTKFNAVSRSMRRVYGKSLQRQASMQPKQRAQINLTRCRSALTNTRGTQQIFWMKLQPLQLFDVAADVVGVSSPRTLV